MCMEEDFKKIELEFNHMGKDIILKELRNETNNRTTKSVHAFFNIKDFKDRYK